MEKSYWKLRMKNEKLRMKSTCISKYQTLTVIDNS